MPALFCMPNRLFSFERESLTHPTTRCWVDSFGNIKTNALPEDAGFADGQAQSDISIIPLILRVTLVLVGLGGSQVCVSSMGLR